MGPASFSVNSLESLRTELVSLSLTIANLLNEVGSEDSLSMAQAYISENKGIGKGQKGKSMSYKTARNQCLPCYVLDEIWNAADVLEKLLLEMSTDPSTPDKDQLFSG